MWGFLALQSVSQPTGGHAVERKHVITFFCSDLICIPSIPAPVDAVGRWRKSNFEREKILGIPTTMVVQPYM
jgi:hypothetical protein